MNGQLLSNAIGMLSKGDTLYVLGDFSFDVAEFSAYRMALESVCETIFVAGNHDPKKFRSSLPLALELKHNHRATYLCHYPWSSWRPNTVMLHGHCHGNPVPPHPDARLRMRFDVGVDTEWDGRKYFPISIEQIENRIEKEKLYDGGDVRGRE